MREAKQQQRSKGMGLKMNSSVPKQYQRSGTVKFNLGLGFTRVKGGRGETIERKGNRVWL